MGRGKSSGDQQGESDLGSRLVANADGIFHVLRQPTRTGGWELNGRWIPNDLLTFATGYSILEGRFDGNADGRLESDLGAADIGRDRLIASADVNPAGRFSGRVQGFKYFDRTFSRGDGTVAASFDGYTTVDATAAAKIGFSTVSFSISNLLDEQYITYYGQAATTRGDRYFAGRGRTLSLGLETRF